MQYHDKGVFCVSWKGIRLESHLLERWVHLVIYQLVVALKFAVCIMIISKGVVNVYVG